MKQNLVGKRFGRLEVLSPSDERACDGELMSVCRCDCGTIKAVRNRYLVLGRTRSCGCLFTDFTRRPRMHGHARSGAKTSEYRIWLSMKSRCQNSKDRNYKYYGGRGISVCKRWSESFCDFLKDMDRRPPGMQLDRINNNRGYEPGNCRWTTAIVNCNNRRDNVFLELDGVKHTLPEWSRIMKCNPNTLRSRRRQGWSDREVILGRATRTS